MNRKFQQIHYSAAAQSELPPEAPQAVGTLRRLIHSTDERIAARDPAMAAALSSWNDEHASRFYLDSFLQGTGDAAMMELTAPRRPELMPDFVMSESREQSLTSTRVVTYQQMAKSIPIFGGRAVVEMDAKEKTLVAINANLAELPDISAEAQLSPAEALRKLAEFGGVKAEEIAQDNPPVLTWFDDDDADRWRLAWHFQRVPMQPPDTTEDAELQQAVEKLKEAGIDTNRIHLHCCGASRSTFGNLMPRFDYFVDAADGSVFFYFSSSAHLDVPTPGMGFDDAGVSQTFFTLSTDSGFQLVDPVRNIETYDLEFADIDSVPAPQFPSIPVSNPVADFGTVNPPAVSAHIQAVRVFDFYNNVLKRNGLDDRGMSIISLVNVFSSAENPEPPPNWRNAAWTGQFMIYGQVSDGIGGLISLTRFLDVIGHELTHAVTEFTSNLIYQSQQGALNESFSDIFGVIVNNWFPGQPQPLSSWNWEIGPGLADDGGPLRNFRDPASAGQPAHMSQFQPLPLSVDNGGVHIFSGIHNRAAFNVLSATDTSNNAVFTPLEVAILYYLTLTRLTRTSDFLDCRRTLLSVADTFFASDAVNRTAKRNAIRNSYDAVGITDPLSP